MEMYDEDLTVNTFFKSLQAENPVLYDIAATRRWLICIPRQGSLGKCQFNDTDFENHVLFRDEEKDDSHYCSANKKELKLKNNIITTCHGFKEERVVPILFEETFFNKNDESYQVLCINQPLEGATVYGRDPDSDTKQITLHHITDCADLLYRKNANVKVQIALENHMHQFIQGLSGLENSTLSDLLNAGKSFYLKGLQIVMKDTKLKKRCQNEQGLHETVKIALESFLLHNVYKRLFINICTCNAYKDSRLNSITRNLRDLQLKDLDVRPEFCQNVPKARKELSNLVRYFTPLGKLICLKRVFRVLMQASGGVRGTTECMPLTTDDLLPMVMFLIIKAEEGHWWATFSYVTMFRFAKPNNDDEYGFFLATMEAALEHISSNQLGAYLQSRRTKEISLSCSPAKGGTLWQHQDQQTSCLNQYFQHIYVGDLEAMQDMLKKKMSPLVDTSQLCHPLCDCDKCKRIMKSSQDANEELKVTLDSADERGWTGLHMAASCGHIEILDWLLQQKMDANVKDIQGHTPLHIACMTGHQSATFLLLHHGAKPNTQDNENNTALHLATLHGYEDCVQALVYYDQGNTAMDLDIVNDFGDTALHLASKWGYLSICTILIENSANVKIRNRKNQTAEDLAHNLRITHLFVNNNVQQKLRQFTKSVQKTAAQIKQRRSSTPADLKPSSNKSSLMSGIGREMAKSPVRVKPQPNPKVDKLLKAILNQDLELAKFHLNWDDNSDSDSEVLGQSPFSSDQLCHPLCQCPKCAPVQHLRSPAGRDVHINSQNAEGVSPLHVAAQCGYTDMTKLFLQRGALVNLATYAEGYTPLHLAIKNQRSEEVQILLRHKAEVNMADARGNAAVHHAAICGSDNILTWLLDFGGDKDQQNIKGNTPLHESCQAGHVTCVRLLVEYGARINIRNNANKLPSHLSQREKVLSIIRYAALKSESEDNAIIRGDHKQDVTDGISRNPERPKHLRHTTPSKPLSNEQIAQQSPQFHKGKQQKKLVRSSTTDGVTHGIVGGSSAYNRGQLGSENNQILSGDRRDQFSSEAERTGDTYADLDKEHMADMLQYNVQGIHQQQQQYQPQSSKVLGSNLSGSGSSNTYTKDDKGQFHWAIGSSEFWSAVNISPHSSPNDSKDFPHTELPYLDNSHRQRHHLLFKDDYFSDNQQQPQQSNDKTSSDLKRHEYFSDNNEGNFKKTATITKDTNHQSCDIKELSEQVSTCNMSVDNRIRNTQQLTESLQTVCDSLSEDSRTESEKDLPIE